MKKRIFSMLVAVAMVVGMLPTVAFATENSSGITEDGGLTLYSASATAADAYTWRDTDGNGSYDTLTLTDDLTLTGMLYLYCDGTINLDGHTLTINAQGNSGIDATEHCDLTINGTGTLDIKSGITGIHAKNITINDVKVAIDTGSTGINAFSGSLTLNNVDATIAPCGEGINASASDLTITGDSKIDITADANGIFLSNAELTIEDGSNVTINAEDNGIKTNAFGDAGYTAINITTSGTVDITAGGYGMYAYVDSDTCTGNITIGGSADVNVKTTGNGANGIEASDGNIEISGSANVNVKTTGRGAHGINASSGNIIISDTSNVTVNAKGSTADGIRVNGNDIKITTTGNVTTYAAGFGINTVSETGSITITDATLVNTSVDSINSPTIKINGNANVSSTSKLALGGEHSSYYDDVIVSSQVEGTFTLDDATLNAVVAVANEDYTTTYTVYGNVVATSTLQAKVLFDGHNDLIFAENATLIINEGVALSLLSYSTSSDSEDTISGSIDWNNANVINNGIIYLNNKDYKDTDIASLSITGDGYIALMKATWNGENYNYATSGVYHNDGTAVAYVVNNDDDKTYDEILKLDTTSVENNENYSWTVVDGVGTLTVNDDCVFNSGIEITGVSSVNIIADGKLTIAGRGVDDNLTATEIGDLTITGDLVVTEYIWIDGKLTVNDNLVAGAVFAGSMEVPTGATVNLLGAEFGKLDSEADTYNDDDKTYALRLSDETDKPTLTLGDVDILTAGVTYSAAYYTNNACYIGTFINEGDTPDFNTLTWYNIATAVSMGKKRSSSTNVGTIIYPDDTTETTNEEETTTNDDGSVTTTVETSVSTSNGTTSTTVTDSSVETAIESAVEAADGESAHLEIAVGTTSSTDTVEVTLSTDAITAVADSDVESLTITSDLGTITIPSDALAEIASNATGSDIVITIIAMEDNTHLIREQQTLVKDAQVYDLHITSDGETIESFGGHEITVTLPYELAEGESAEHIVIWYLGDDDEMAALEGDFDAENGTATFATPHFSYYAALHHNNPFEDVVLEDYYYAPVQWALEMNITTGTSDTTFSPAKVCTRAEAVMFFWNAAGKPEATGDMIFTDVDADAYYYDAVLWTVANGITAGTTETTFSPNADCTRGQIVTFLYRAAGEPEVSSDSTFADVDSDNYCYNAVLWAVSNGITNGMGDGTFGVDQPCTRAQIVTFLYRYFG